MTRVDGQPESDGRPTAASNQLNRIDAIREQLNPTRPGYEAEPISIEDGRWILGWLDWWRAFALNGLQAVAAVDPVGQAPAAASDPARKGICQTCGQPCVYQGTHP